MKLILGPIAYVVNITPYTSGFRIDLDLKQCIN
jgi:hypothetical protein